MTRSRLMLVLTLALGAGACGGSEQLPPTAGVSPGPALVVERFLQAANANDLDVMMQLFGTADRTIIQIDGRSQAERRMYVLASLLRHDDYAILGQEALPGRSRTATRLDVRLTQGQRQTLVPYVVVRKSDGGWIIERIDIEELTDAR